MDNGKVSLSSRLLVRHGLCRPCTHFSRVLLLIPPRQASAPPLDSLFPTQVFSTAPRCSSCWLELTLANSRRQLTGGLITPGPSYGLSRISQRSIFSEDSSANAFN